MIIITTTIIKKEALCHLPRFGSVKCYFSTHSSVCLKFGPPNYFDSRSSYVAQMKHWWDTFCETKHWWDTFCGARQRASRAEETGEIGRSLIEYGWMKFQPNQIIVCDQVWTIFIYQLYIYKILMAQMKEQMQSSNGKNLLCACMYSVCLRNKEIMK